MLDVRLPQRLRDLTSYRQFLVLRGTTPVPLDTLQPSDGFRAFDRHNWMSVGEALDVADRKSLGVAFCLTKQDPFTAMVLKTPTGDTDGLSRLVDMLGQMTGSYTAASPSGSFLTVGRTGGFPKMRGRDAQVYTHNFMFGIGTPSASGLVGFWRERLDWE